MSKRFSVIVPVYNRPDEVDELLQSLVQQTLKNFEVLIIEDGSTQPCKEVAEKYSSQLGISYYFKENSGQGMSRNYGFARAKGNYFIVFDSDCIIPSHYFQTISEHLDKNALDAFGGPDRAHNDFSALQKAISYSMTSLFTTGGIRGEKKHIGPFHPRSFNMGISKAVFDKTGGYIIPRLGEDIEFSIRIINNGFKTGLIPDAYVYHKRRTSFSQFWKQLHFFGRARINIGRFYPSQIKLVHMFPSFFVIGLMLYLVSAFVSETIFFMGSILLALWVFSIFTDSTIKNKSIKVGAYSIVTSFIQLTAYGIGFITEAFRYNKSPYDASQGL